MGEAFRRMVFNVTASNCDDHTKNFSFLLRQGQGWELAPAYDVTHAYNPEGQWTYQHRMGVNGRFAEIRREDTLALASRYAIEDADDIIEQAGNAVDRWPEFARAAGVKDTDMSRIQAYHRVDQIMFTPALSLGSDSALSFDRFRLGWPHP